MADEQSANIKFIKFCLEDFNSLASVKLNLAINVTDPYKICDLRPAFGVIFEDFLKPYTFWGHTDIDVIFGNIRHFITNQLLENHDILTARKEYLTGHFTLYKNTKEINKLYALTDDHQYIFKWGEYLGFDECNFLWWKLMEGHDISIFVNRHMSMTLLVKRLQKDNKVRALFTQLVLEQDHKSNSFDRLLIWEDGILTDHDTHESFLYFHFHFLKKRTGFICPEWNTLNQSFFISSTGFRFETE
jgi:hypothetical protein